MVSILEIADRHVSRAIDLIDAQTARVREFERRGWNAEPAQTLLAGMLSSFRLMVEHRDRLQGEAVDRRSNLGEAIPATLDGPVWPLALHNGLPWPLAPPHLRRSSGSPASRAVTGARIAAPTDHDVPRATRSRALDEATDPLRVARRDGSR